MIKALSIAFLFIGFQLPAQSCEEWISIVKENHQETNSYKSPQSSAIERVNFYVLEQDGQAFYFAIVCFKAKPRSDCKEFIYQVSDSTELYYALSYKTSAGKAFWKYIAPHQSNLNCGSNKT